LLPLSSEILRTALSSSVKEFFITELSLLWKIHVLRSGLQEQTNGEKKMSVIKGFAPIPGNIKIKSDTTCPKCGSKNVVIRNGIPFEVARRSGRSLPGALLDSLSGSKVLYCPDCGYCAPIFL
jgi:DNA-directed RNA polymerase subunit RPC12/RpoP